MLLSCSSKGHISTQGMKLGLFRLGKFATCPPGAIGHYRPNRAASKMGVEVNGFLAEVEHAAAGRLCDAQSNNTQFIPIHPVDSCK